MVIYVAPVGVRSELMGYFLSFIWGRVPSVPSSRLGVSLQTCSSLAPQMFLVYRPDGLKTVSGWGRGSPSEVTGCTVV